MSPSWYDERGMRRTAFWSCRRCGGRVHPKGEPCPVEWAEVWSSRTPIAIDLVADDNRERALAALSALRATWEAERLMERRQEALERLDVALRYRGPGAL